jgi:hypothetical protein
MSIRRALGLGVLLAVIGHQLALAAGRLAVYGTGLQASDHGTAWALAVALVIAGAVLAAGLAGWRIVAFRLRLRVAPTLSLPTGGALVRTWAALTLLALAVFVAQENVEHLTQHGHLPLLEPLLSGPYAAVVPVFAGLGLLLAASGLAIGTTLQRLERAVRASGAHRQPPPRRLGAWRTLLHDRRRFTRMITALSSRRGPPLPISG